MWRAKLVDIIIKETRYEISIPRRSQKHKFGVLEGIHFRSRRPTEQNSRRKWKYFRNQIEIKKLTN